LLTKNFEEVYSDDRTTTFVKVLKREINSLRTEKEGFLKDFSAKDYQDLISGWEQKVVRAAENDQRWGLFLATKH
jgi:phosphoethanolamine N-methyltransferase